ncbi:MAG: MATE family efflux transporter [Butyricimonas synergistica]|nr:MAG: MATE family efflux transporter [Butyricimonas synergistica]
MNFTSKQIWLINYPVMMSVLVEQLINITDAIFLGHIGETELGASAIAGMYYLSLYILGFGFSLGLQVMIARRNGERRPAETGKVFFQGLFFLTTLAISLVTLSKVFTPFILQHLLTSTEIYEAVIQYLDWRTFGLFFAFPMLAFRAFFVGITKTRVLTASAISGAAMASTISELGGLFVLVIYTRFKIDKRHYGLFPIFNQRLMGQLFRLSVWSMMHSFISVTPWFLFFILIEHLGTTQLAIANIIRSISTIFFVIVSSFSTTTGSLVSNLAGAGERNQIMPLCRKIIRLGYLLGIPLIVIALLFPHVVMGIYTPDRQLVQLAFWPFVVMLSNYILSLPAHVFCNAVSGTGATRAAFIYQCITIAIYLIYLSCINRIGEIPLAVYWTSEHLYVLLLFLFSWFHLKRTNEKIIKL